MRAIMLLRTNPGSQEEAERVLKATLAAAAKDVKVESVCHVFGRFDGVVVCNYEKLTSLNHLAEMLRRKGIFHTETLIAIE